VVTVHEAFEPEGGAYSSHGHAQGHGHIAHSHGSEAHGTHAHSHDHHAHDHVHGPNCKHDH
jgi:urease accessory protein